MPLAVGYTLPLGNLKKCTLGFRLYTNMPHPCNDKELKKMHIAVSALSGFGLNDENL